MSYLKAKEDFYSINLAKMRQKGFLKTILDRQKNNKEAVDKNHGWKERNCCPLCGSSNRSFQFEKFGMSLYQCLDCEIGYFDSVPINTNDVYSADHALNDAQTAYLNNKNYRMERFAKERLDLIKNNIGMETNNVNILDVGCGTGWFLEAAKERGYSVFGLELGEELSRFTAERLDIIVYNLELEQLEVDTGFDVITMFDLIEHVKNPLQQIQAAKNLLNEGGIILIFTPNFDSVAIQTMKEKSNLIMPAEHLTYFTKKSIDKLAELADMNLTYFVTKGIDIGDLKGYFDYTGNLNLEEACMELYDVIQPVIDHSNSGNHLRCILKRNK